MWYPDARPRSALGAARGLSLQVGRVRGHPRDGDQNRQHEVVQWGDLRARASRGMGSPRGGRGSPSTTRAGSPSTPAMRSTRPASQVTAPRTAANASGAFDGRCARPRHAPVRTPYPMSQPPSTASAINPAVIDRIASSSAAGTTYARPPAAPSRAARRRSGRSTMGGGAAVRNRSPGGRAEPPLGRDRLARLGRRHGGRETASCRHATGRRPRVRSRFPTWRARARLARDAASAPGAAPLRHPRRPS